MKTAVLLVEDERDTREILARALTRAGHRCLTAQGPAEALAHAETPDPAFDVAVIDIVLDKDDHGGLDLLRTLRQRGVTAPVVIITAFADVEKVKLALNGGADYLLEKPFRAPDLLDVLAKVGSDVMRRRSVSDNLEEVLRRARLTAKEHAVAIRLLEGLSSSEIAVLEANSPKTIRQHVSQIYAKCGVGSRAEFFRLAYAR